MPSGPKINILEESSSAVQVLADHLGIAPEMARGALLALVKAGWYIAPHEPTNSMLVASLNATGKVATNLDTIATSFGKARWRWKAMAETGTRMALSKRVS